MRSYRKPPEADERLGTRCKRAPDPLGLALQPSAGRFNRTARHRMALQLLIDSGFLKVAYNFPQSGVPTWEFDPRPDGIYDHATRQELLPVLIMLLQEDRIWPFLLDDPEYIQVCGTEHFGLLLIEQFQDLSDQEHDLISAGRIPMEEAIQQLQASIKGQS